MPDRPTIVVLDVNETLSDLSSLGEAFQDAGLDPTGLDAWFAGVLRDGFALTVLGDNPSFADVASATLRARATAAGHPDPAAATEQVMAALPALEPHPDVVPGLVALADLGCRIVTLSNGSAEVGRALLSGTDAERVVESYLSVADAGVWKPAAAAYAHALERTGVPAREAMLVAVHPWDIAGAHRAELRTAWISRGGHYPDHMPRADVEAASFEELAQALAG